MPSLRYKGLEWDDTGHYMIRDVRQVLVVVM